MRTRTVREMAAAALVLGIVSVWAPAATAAEKAASKIELVGQDISNWQEDGRSDWTITGEPTLDPDEPNALVYRAGSGVLGNGPRPVPPKIRKKNLVSKAKHGDVEAHLEFMVPQGSNSGMYFQGRYEIQILDSWKVENEKLMYSDCGGIYQRWKQKEKLGYEGHAPRVNASKAPGEWQSFDVVFRAPHFDAAGNKIANASFVKVVHNGQVIHENVEMTGPTRAAAFEHDEKPLGPLMLQGDHGPVVFRNVWLRPVQLDP